MSADTVRSTLRRNSCVLMGGLPLRKGPKQGGIILFADPLLGSAIDGPLLLDHYVNVPKSAVLIDNSKCRIGKGLLPRSPHTLGAYFVARGDTTSFLGTLRGLDVPIQG